MICCPPRSVTSALTERVLGGVFEVSNTLGAGFLEKVYQRALLHELRLRGIRAATEVLGEYFADILVEALLVIELKCAERFSNEHPAPLRSQQHLYGYGCPYN